MVLEVHYRFNWNGSRVISVEADVLMGNISLPENSTETLSGNGDKKQKEIVSSRQRFHFLYQFFSTSFKSFDIDDSTTSMGKQPRLRENSNKLSIVHKSGSPGYNKGKPLLSALYKFKKVVDKQKVK